MIFNSKKLFNVVFGLFAARVLFLVLVPPFCGIANNGDFQRLMIPVGLDYRINPWTAENYYDNFFNWVTNDYIYITPVDNGWRNIFEIFPRLAIIISNRIVNGKFDIRYMGIVNAIFYLFSVWILVKLIEKIQNRWRYVLLCMALLVLGDTYIIQYMNSFYSEIGSVTFILLLWDMLIIGFLYMKDGGVAHKIIYVLISSIAAIFSVLCKQQDILLILPVSVIFFLLFRHLAVKLKYTILWLICFWTICLWAFSINEGDGNITVFNVISEDMMEISKCPEEHLKDMGLSDSEIELFISGIGLNAYTLLYYDWSVFSDKISRMDEVKIIINEPQVFIKMLVKRSRNLFKDAPLGNYTKESGATCGEKTNENRLWYKVKQIVYENDALFYFGVCMVAILLALVGRYIYFLSEIPAEVFKVYLLIPLSNLLRFFTVLMGDCSSGDFKHFFSTNFEFDIIYICNFILLSMIIYGFLKEQYDKLYARKAR